MARRVWFDREFTLGLPVEAFPDILERVRGTPARIEDRLQDASPDLLTKRLDDRWSIQENVGHLLDLEPLWEGRLDELLVGEAQLRPADLKNAKTHQAGHNMRLLKELVDEFRRERMRVVDRLGSLTETQLRATALHPRLQQPMTIVDLFFFVAEHDDHHLARVGEIIGANP